MVLHIQIIDRSERTLVVVEDFQSYIGVEDKRLLQEQQPSIGITLDAERGIVVPRVDITVLFCVWILEVGQTAGSVVVESVVVIQVRVEDREKRVCSEGGSDKS